ncbi:Der GTPase-activating protein YihI [Thalassotalea euphylliae]|uniref:Der GTPase-activating protein YihI n=1 Tax=Thalassotalea euphylliae TaxID=1655234 RepID=UPI00362CC022
MTRKKKSRKPGRGSIGLIKADNTLKETAKDKKPRKKTGKPAGSRQTEAVKKKRVVQSGGGTKDERIGSKTPIVLVKSDQKPASHAPTKVKKPSAIPGVRVIDRGPSIAEQIEQIEQDERLLTILAKQEEGELLSSEEVDYYNDLMDKHEQLSEQLEDTTRTPDVEEPMDEDALWDKLDGSDLSDYE